MEEEFFEDCDPQPSTPRISVCKKRKRKDEDLLEYLRESDKAHNATMNRMLSQLEKNQELILRVLEKN